MFSLNIGSLRAILTVVLLRATGSKNSPILGLA